MEWKGTRGMSWGFPQKFSVGPGLGEVEGCMVGKSGWTPARLCTPIFCWGFLNGPQLRDFEGVMVGKWDSDVLGPSAGGLVWR